MKRWHYNIGRFTILAIPVLWALTVGIIPKLVLQIFTGFLLGVVARQVWGWWRCRWFDAQARRLSFTEMRAYLDGIIRRDVQ